MSRKTSFQISQIFISAYSFSEHTIHTQQACNAMMIQKNFVYYTYYLCKEKRYKSTGFTIDMMSQESLSVSLLLGMSER